MAGWTGPVYPNNTQPEGLDGVQDCGTSGCLYDIRRDPHEHTDLAQSEPEVLSRMQAKLKEYQASIFSPNRGKMDRNMICEAALDKYGGFWGPFLP